MIMFVFPLASCSDDFYEIIGRFDAATDSWSSYNPLTIYGYPFKPQKINDPESELGIMMWAGMKEGVQAYAEQTNGKVQYKGIASDNRKEYHIGNWLSCGWL